MGRPRRTIVPLDAEATDTRTETMDAPAPPLPSPAAAVEPDPVPTQPQRTPERQRLADAIGTVAALQAEIAEANAAVSEAGRESTAAFIALEEAEQVLRHATPRAREIGDRFVPPSPSPGHFWGSEEAHAAHVAAEVVPPVSIADAKAAVASAEDARASAQRLVQYHQGRLKTASDRLQWNASTVRDAIRSVVRSEPALLALAAESRRLATRAEAARRAFSAATGGDTIQPGSPYYGAGTVADARTSPEAREDWALSRAWSEALDALQSDPDAPMPMP